MELSTQCLFGVASELVGESRGVAQEVGSTVADVDRGRADARRLPVDETSDETACPQHVSGVVVTMDEAPAPVEDRAAEYLDRPLPDSGLPRPLRGRVRLLRVVLVNTDRP